MYQLDSYAKLILSAVSAGLAHAPTVTDEQILPAVQQVYPDITLEGLRPRLVELGENWLQVEGSGNTETVTVTGIQREWSDDATAGDTPAGVRDPGRE